MEAKSRVKIFLDDDPKLLGEFDAPVTFDLDTRRMSDGRHVLKILSEEASGKEGIRLIPFIVRNGPAIDVEGLKDNQTVDGVLPLLINAYGKGDQKSFIIYGSETPRGIPSWVIILLVLFFGWAVYYLITYATLRP
jgi:hypothetical protein